MKAPTNCFSVPSKGYQLKARFACTDFDDQLTFLSVGFPSCCTVCVYDFFFVPTKIREGVVVIVVVVVRQKYVPSVRTSSTSLTIVYKHPTIDRKSPTICRL